MEVNKEEALRCLSIAQKHRNGSNFPSALKFAKKSVSLFSTPEGEAMVTIIERDISKSGSAENESPPTSASASASGASTSRAKATGVEEHVTSAHQRPGHKTSSTNANAEASGSGAGTKKREYTTKQIEVVKRVKSCKHHEYYQILAGESNL
jgi:DnaJ family protein B protein 12